MVKLSTSILSKPFIDTIIKLNKTDTDYIHIDVMDGFFVPEKAFNINDIKEISSYSNKPLDIHLMVNNIESYLSVLNLSNTSILTVHYEVLNNEKLIDEVRKKGIKFGLSVKPNTDITKIFNLLEKIDVVLIMSVEPGKGGQEFLSDSLIKIKTLKEEIIKRHLNVLIAVDGGINDSNTSLCIKNGADILIVGTYIIDNNDYQSQIMKLKR